MWCERGKNRERVGIREWLCAGKGSGSMRWGCALHAACEQQESAALWDLTLLLLMVCTVWGTRARQVLDLRRSLQKLDMAERELASAFVGAVVSSALPNSAFADPASAHLPSPWAGSLGGFVPERACAPAGNGCGNVLEGGGCEEGPDGFEEMVVKDVADEARMVLNEVEEEEEEEGEEEG